MTKLLYIDKEKIAAVKIQTNTDDGRWHEVIFFGTGSEEPILRVRSDSLDEATHMVRKFMEGDEKY